MLLGFFQEVGTRGPKFVARSIRQPPRKFACEILKGSLLLLAIGYYWEAPRGSLVLMKELALIYILLLAASPAAAQLATSQRVQQLGGESVQSTPIEAPRTGVFCIEEMTATFCNVTTAPNTSGYGRVSTSRSGASSSGVSASSGGAGAISPSIPPCSSEPPFNELCN